MLSKEGQTGTRYEEIVALSLSISMKKINISSDFILFLHQSCREKVPNETYVLTSDYSIVLTRESMPPRLPAIYVSEIKSRFKFFSFTAANFKFKI